MTLALLDLPSPIFDALDAALESAYLPTLARVALYACACAFVGMRLYRRHSDQAALGVLRDEIARTQRALALHEGGFGELHALIRRNLALSIRQLGMTLKPALIASLPLLFVMPWLSNRFGIEAPAPGTHVAACARPAEAAQGLRWEPAAAAPRDGCWQLAWPADDAHLKLEDAQGTLLFAVPAAPRSDIVHKFIFLNWLVGNPDGYLPDSAPLDALTLALPQRALVPLGPAWLRGWEPWYFGILLIVSVALKLRWNVN